MFIINRFQDITEQMVISTCIVGGAAVTSWRWNLMAKKGVVEFMKGVLKAGLAKLSIANSPKPLV